MAGQAAPVLQGCILQGKKCGLRAMMRSEALLLDTRMEKCGLAGVQAMDESVVTCCRCVGCPFLGPRMPHLLLALAVRLYGFARAWPDIDVFRCEVTEGMEEGAVVMDSAQLRLDSCLLHGCRGPAVDVSGQGRATSAASKLCDNAGAALLSTQGQTRAAKLLVCLGLQAGCGCGTEALRSCRAASCRVAAPSWSWLTPLLALH